jgi:hypothetical protein
MGLLFWQRPAFPRKPTKHNMCKQTHQPKSFKKHGFATAVREVIENTKLGRILRYLASFFQYAEVSFGFRLGLAVH